MDGLLIRGLGVDDIPGALALGREAGWNQTADDWRLFLRLAPETCRAACIDGRLVGTVTVLPYGPFAWIGMVHDFDHLGPLVARESSIASMLASAALTKVNRRVVIDVPLERDTFREWLTAWGFQFQRPLTKMARGSLPNPSCPAALFALLGPEFG